MAEHASGVTPYKPPAVTFARHRTIRQRIVWHLDGLAADAVVRIGERGMRGK